MDPRIKEWWAAQGYMPCAEEDMVRVYNRAMKELEEKEASMRARAARIEAKRVEVKKVLYSLKEGESYGLRGDELIPWSPQDFGNGKDVITKIQKVSGRLIATCQTSGNLFGSSKEGYRAVEEIDITDLV